MSAWKEKSPFEAYPVALCLVGACGIIFIATDAGLLDGRFSGLKAWGRAWLPGFATGELWRPLTAMFLHGGVIHVLVNGYALMALCPSMEARVGSARFAAIYFGAGISGSLCSMGWEHASVGASGAIFGIMGAYLRLARVESGSFRGMARHPVGSQLLGWLALNLVLGFTMPGISNAGHLGGLLGGWIVSAGVLPAGGGAARGLILPVVSWPKIAAAAAFLLALAAVDLLVVAPR
ncbi:MAG: rhomboid family intramembrane serine protease, partial [Candidatus Brocadiae bacterium]|nr:rhomboid family intramembrane serine protease [Candidatus Brocadiia bacterium]